MYRKDIFQQLNLSDPFSQSELWEIADKINQANLIINGISVRGYSGLWCTDPVACYDMAATSWNQIAWSFGGEIWDSTTFTIDGILQSEANVAALDLMIKLIQTGPPNSAR